MRTLPIAPGTSIHLVGIGGSGMSSLAILLRRAGYRVTGSDLSATSVVEDLRADGIPVIIGHTAENLVDATLVIRSSAIPDSNPEVVAARERGLSILKHAELIGRFSNSLRTLAVSGTHGKTTTTAMLASILIHAGLDPIALVGGVLPSLGSGAHFGEGEFFVVEADEFDRRFLELRPEVAIVTNVEPDHLDYYGTFGAIRGAFEGFVDRVSDEGWIILCADYPYSNALSERHPDRSVTYGTSEDADWRASGIAANDHGGNDFVVYAHELLVGYFRLRVPGRHNVTNALAAAVAAGRIGVDFITAAAALESFGGVERRLEMKGRVGGITFVDDYAHHPTKIRASLAALREQHDGRIVCLFQPHHYHRLSSLFDDFVEAFADADVVIVTDVYAPAGRGPAAGERTSVELTKAIGDKRAIFGGSLTSASLMTSSLLTSGDLVVTMGAGDVTTVGAELMRRVAGSRSSS